MFGGGFPGFFNQFGGGDEDDRMEEEDSGPLENKRLYEILGLEPQADISQIRKAYLKACTKGEYRHPDRGGCQEKFKELQKANDVLSDEDKKKIYDKQGLAGIERMEKGGGGGGNPFEDIFGMGGRRQQQRGAQKMKGVRKEVQISLEEAFMGKMTTLQHKRKRNCETCDGKGGSNIKKCGECKGRGVVIKMQQVGPGMYSQSQAYCSKCKGQGEISDPKDICKKCKGEKIFDDVKTIEIAVEGGTYDGYETIYTGEADEQPGYMAGDLHVRFRVKEHPVFKRKGADLYIEKKITLLEALSGLNFTIKQLDGKDLVVSTIPGDIIGCQTVKCVKGKGMPFFKDHYSHGNLYIKFTVEFPKSGDMSKDQIENLKTLLNAKPQKALPKSDKEYEYMEEVHKDEMNPSAQGGHQADDDDDYEDEDGRGGKQQVQCNTQ